MIVTCAGPARAPPTGSGRRRPAAGRPAARVVVLAVHAQVLGELVDALGEQGDLNLGAPGVGRTGPELLDQLLLSLRGQGHARRRLASARRHRARTGPSGA